MTEQYQREEPSGLSTDHSQSRAIRLSRAGADSGTAL